ncbi:MAG: ubiquinol-cytochrome c reductase iron-sulfur subunit [Desulfatiglandales bacterium]
MSNKRKKHAKKGPSPPEPARRSFLNKLWMVLGILALIEMTGLVIVYLHPSKRRAKPGEIGAIVEAGPVERFPLNSVTAFVRGKFYLCRLKDSGFLAVSRKCTHLGCTVPWLDKEKRFACPCHASAFDIRGEVISPPAPRALDIYRLHIENNIVKVDTGKQIKRSGFRTEQVVYAKKA